MMAIEKELPEGWEWKELGDVAVVTSGSPAPQKEKHFQNGTYPFLRTSDLEPMEKRINWKEFVTISMMNA